MSRRIIKDYLKIGSEVLWIDLAICNGKGTSWYGKIIKEVPYTHGYSGSGCKKYLIWWQNFATKKYVDCHYMLDNKMPREFVLDKELIEFCKLFINDYDPPD